MVCQLNRLCIRDAWYSLTFMCHVIALSHCVYPAPTYTVPVMVGGPECSTCKDIKSWISGSALVYPGMSQPSHAVHGRPREMAKQQCPRWVAHLHNSSSRESRCSCLVCRLRRARGCLRVSRCWPAFAFLLGRPSISGCSTSYGLVLCLPRHCSLRLLLFCTGALWPMPAWVWVMSIYIFDIYIYAFFLYGCESGSCQPAPTSKLPNPPVC